MKDASCVKFYKNQEKIMQRIFWTFVCLFLCAATVWAQPEGRRGVGVVPKAHRYALLVGVNTYPRQFQSLQYCEADMEALEEALLAIGFQPENIVRLSTSSDDPSLLPTRSNILKQARLLADQADQGSMFVLALSGHGACLNDESYFCPMDAVYNDLSSLVKRSDLYQIVEECEAKQKLVFVDACRESLVDSGWKPLGGIRTLVDPVGIENPGFFIISSCKTGQFSWEDAELKHGVFTYFLVEGLKGKAAQNGQISVHNLFSYVNYETKKYIRLTRQESQIPLLRGDEEELDDFILAKLESDSSSVPPAVSGPVTPPEPPKPAVRKAGERMVKTVDGIEYAFRWCPAGEFLMGSPFSEPYRNDNETQHSVTLTRGFWMLETEVTQAMWKSVMGTSISQQRDKANTPWPLSGEGSDYPMYFVSWEECRSFCEKLSEKLGLTVSFPTEAQWEYACRAGTTGAYAGMGWYYSNSGGGTYPVGQKKPNAWGLYDMHGNVWEWCQDWYDEDYYTESPTSDPTGPNSGSNRVYRGGGWIDDAQDCRSASRNWHSPDYRINYLGFRPVLASPAPGK